MIAAGGYLTSFDSQTHLPQLQVRLLLLLRPDGSLADGGYLPELDHDRSYSRDANAGWHKDWAVTPGSANHAQ